MAPTTTLFEILLWVGVLILTVLALAVGLLMYRRRVMSPVNRGPEPVLQSLRQMRDSGRLSQEEYDAACRAIAFRAAGKTVEAPPRSVPAAEGVVTARPGYDLTGAPLPGSENGPGGESGAEGGE